MPNSKKSKSTKSNSRNSNTKNPNSIFKQNVLLTGFKKNVIFNFHFVLILLMSSSCTIYRSPERADFEKDFESNSSQFRVQNLVMKNCSNETIQQKSSSKRLVTTLPSDQNSDMNNSESLFLWEYIVEQKSIFESDNLKGVYCVYENK